MPKTKISEFSATPANNTDIDSINISEGCAPSGINDAIRELMAQLKDFQTGAVGDSFNGPVGTTTAAAGAFTTLAASSTVTLSGGTANGVTYLNGSKVVTSGSALVFDGTNLGIGTSSPSHKLDVNGNAQIGNATAGTNRFLYINGVANKASGIAFQESGTNRWLIGNGAASENGNFEIYDATNGNNFILTRSGNLGLGVTPSAWSTGKAMQFNSVEASVWGAGTQIDVASNAYFNGGWKYAATRAGASIYEQSLGTHAWSVAGSGTAGNAITFTQAMTLDASGNLGVGVTSPATRLEVNGVSEGEYFRAGGGTISARSLQFSSFTVSGLAGVGHQINVPNASGVLTFATGSTERARIDSSGNLLLGTTTASLGPTSGFNVIIGGGVTGTSIGHVTGSSSGSYYELFAYNGSAIGSITQSGTTAVLYNTTSDQRLKENIQDADSASTLIDALQVRQFDWKADNSHQRYGFVAQELVTVAPEAVHQPEDTEQMMAVDYSKLVPILVKEVQSLRKRLADAGL